jgi:hypothetical protein
MLAVPLPTTRDTDMLAFFTSPPFARPTAGSEETLKSNGTMQVPLWHVAVPAQALPTVPQLLLLVNRFVSQPSAGLLFASAVPDGQELLLHIDP